MKKMQKKLVSYWYAQSRTQNCRDLHELAFNFLVKIS